MSQILCSYSVDPCSVQGSRIQQSLCAVRTGMQPLPRCSPPYASRIGQSIRDFPVELTPVIFVGQIGPYCLDDTRKG